MDQHPDPTPPEGLSRADLRLVGLLATGVSLAAQWALTAVLATASFVPAVLAETVIRMTPGDVATFMIERFGHWAMRLLTALVLMGILAAGAFVLDVLGRAVGPRRGPGMGAAALVLAGVLVLATAPAGGASPASALLVLVVGGGVYWASAAWFLGALGAGAGTDEVRRRALIAGAGGAVGLVLGGGLLGYLMRRLAGPDTNVPLRHAVKRARIPQRPPFPEIPGLSREVTSAADHYVVDIDLVSPVVQAAGWTVTVKGEVDRTLELGFEELQSRFEFVEEYATLTCVSNEVGGHLIGHSLWGGVRLIDVLEAAGVRDGAVDVVFRAADGYSDSIPMDVARDPAVILAVAQNRRPLTQDHGFPCRVRVPPIYGMKNCKWLREIEVVGSDYQGYWQQRGWSDDATVRTESRIDVAGEDGAAKMGEETWIAGVAWAGDRGISRVEVSTDAGELWQEAELREPIGPTSWQQWAFRWTPSKSGIARVMCRATDGDGRLQTERVSPPHPAGATGYPALDVEVS